MTLRCFRKQKKVTQEELARKVGVSQAYICALESGKRENPSIYILVRIAKVLDITIEDLIGPHKEVM